MMDDREHDVERALSALQHKINEPAELPPGLIARLQSGVRRRYSVSRGSRAVVACIGFLAAISQTETQVTEGYVLIAAILFSAYAYGLGAGARSAPEMSSTYGQVRSD